MTRSESDRAPDRGLRTVGTTVERIARVSPAARAVHRSVLRTFAATGTPPDRCTLIHAAGGADLAGLLAELHEHDVIRLADSGAIQVAYPFSARPTAHVVDLDGGPSVYAMCAVDALGMSAMLHRPVTINSNEPDTRTPIAVTVDNTRSTWWPDTTVVVIGSTRSPTTCDPAQNGPDCDAISDLGATADVGCGVMNFFTHPDRAADWLTAHPEVTGEVLACEQALRLGVSVFGHLLDPQPS